MAIEEDGAVAQGPSGGESRGLGAVVEGSSKLMLDAGGGGEVVGHCCG